MKQAIGMAELTTVSSGIAAADFMVKTAQVEIIEAQVVCPGKYIVLVCGGIAAVKAAVDGVKTQFAKNVSDSFVLGNPHESLFGALYGTARVEQVRALGVLETYSAPSIITAADAAAKTAVVDLIELRVARGMCGKSYMLLSGEVAAVDAAIARAQAVAGGAGLFLDSTVIANPDQKLWKTIL